MKRQLSSNSFEKSPYRNSGLALDRIEKVKSAISILASRKTTEKLLSELCKLLPTIISCESICLICIQSLQTLDDEWNNTDLQVIKGQIEKKYVDIVCLGSLEVMH